MAHEIEANDGLVLVKQPAWHGLGKIVSEAPTPLEALPLAGLDWEVEQWPMYATDGDVRLTAAKVANVRSDTKEILGYVAEDWQPFQNSEVAQFCEDLAMEGDKVTIETAGSIRNGRKIWFLLRGESFDAGKGDEVAPYICVSNGFDGQTAFRATPTTVRVVCSNTLHAVVPDETGRRKGKLALRQNSFVCHHTGNMADRVEQARGALELYGKAVAAQREQIDRLTAKDVNSEMVKQFFLECYTRDFKAIPTTPGKVRDKALDAVASMTKRFEEEGDDFGTNAWVMMNAYTGWLQNDRPVRTKDPVAAAEGRAYSKLFATDSCRTLDTLSLALTV